MLAKWIWFASKPKVIWELAHKGLGAAHFPKGKCSHPSQMMLAPYYMGDFAKKSYLRSGLFWFEWYLVKTIILDIKNKLLSASKEKNAELAKALRFLSL